MNGRTMPTTSRSNAFGLLLVLPLLGGCVRPRARADTVVDALMDRCLSKAPEDYTGETVLVKAADGYPIYVTDCTITAARMDPGSRTLSSLERVDPARVAQRLFHRLRPYEWFNFFYTDSVRDKRQGSRSTLLLDDVGSTIVLQESYHVDPSLYSKPSTFEIRVSYRGPSNVSPLRFFAERRLDRPRFLSGAARAVAEITKKDNRALARHKAAIAPVVASYQRRAAKEKARQRAIQRGVSLKLNTMFQPRAAAHPSGPAAGTKPVRAPTPLKSSGCGPTHCVERCETPPPKCAGLVEARAITRCLKPHMDAAAACYKRCNKECGRGGPVKPAPGVER